MEHYLIPNYIKEYFIYDIYHNDNGDLIIILPCEIEAPSIKYYVNDNNYLDFKINKCPYNHTSIYYLKTEYKT